MSGAEKGSKREFIGMDILPLPYTFEEEKKKRTQKQNQQID